MKNLLHISDFHFKEEIEIENKVLKNLVSFLTQKNITIDYLVHTGDFVDGRTIADCCGKRVVESNPDCFEKEYETKTFNLAIKKAEARKKGIIESYNHQLLQLYEERFNIVFEKFQSFYLQLKVPISNIVICCGNHDKARLIDESGSECKYGSYSYSENEISAFSPFKLFCNKLKLDYDFNTYLKKTEDFNFLILNSNWTVPSSFSINTERYSCINCSQLTSVLEDYDKTDESKPNIVVVHKPIDDFCEYFKYKYEGIDPLSSRLDSETQLYLCGDKHTSKDSKRGYIRDYLCGAPLRSAEIIYNLIEYNDITNQFNCKHLVWKNDSWSIIPVDALLESTYSLSKEYFPKNISLFLQTQIPKRADQALTVLGEFKKERTEYASELFKASSEYKESGKNSQSWNDENIFEYILGKIKNYKSIIPLYISGICGTGKSTFLGIEYLYLLEEFKNGVLQHLPVYFNAQKSGIDLLKRKNFFNDFFKQTKRISQEYNVPILYIIDGLDEKNCIGNETSLENEIYDKLMTNKNIHDIFVLCYNEYHLPKFLDNTKPTNSDYTLIFHAVNTISLGTDKNWFEIFLNAYMVLKGETDSDVISALRDKILDYRKISITLSFLHSNYNDIVRFVKESKTGWDILLNYGDSLKKYCEQKLNMEENNLSLPLAAFLFSYNGKNYEEIRAEAKCKTGRRSINIESFSLIKNNEEVRKFLIAKHYINELTFYASNTSETIESESILNKYLSRDIAIMIRLAITDNNAVLQSIDKVIGRLEKQALSIPYYLVGHLRIDSAEKEQLIKTWNTLQVKKADKKSRTKKIAEDERLLFLKQASERSKKITEIICSCDLGDYSKLFDYLHELISNRQHRIYNRIYQLLYYEDLSINGENTDRVLSPGGDYLHEGFDFKNCFNTLLSKLEYNYSRNIRYHIMEIDLFTLCDIVYSRLQSPSISYRGKEVESFFYAEKYNGRDSRLSVDVLDKTFLAVKEYLSNIDKLNSSLKQTDRIYIYFSMMKEMFEECLHVLRRRSTSSWEPIDLLKKIHPSRPFIDLQDLEKMSRIGWVIDEKGGFDEDKRKEYSENFTPKETILEHIFEAISIALLYLPDKISKEDISTSLSDEQFVDDNKVYNKEKIFVYIFIHEFGKTKTKDYTPDSDDKDLLKQKETQRLLSFLNLGAVDGFASMDYYYKMVEEGISESKRDINIIIAKDIIGVQREYKLALLKQKKMISFSQRREEDFKNSTKIKTNIGKHIMDRVVKYNPMFSSF